MFHFSMNYYLSDLHLTEDPVHGGVPDAVLAAFVDRLSDQPSVSPKTIVFVGDILELLRSPRWSSLWSSRNSAPWSGASPGFSNFENSHAENCALEIASGIRARYEGFSERLREGVSNGRLKICYLPGNHDYMVQLSPRLRASVAEFLSLEHDPKKQFPLCHLDREASVYATHGHSFDPLNWHREADGYWAMGDAVVLRIINRFAEEACSVLGIAPETELGGLVQDIENVEPHTDVPLYILWMAGTLSVEATRRTLLATWKTVVEEFLALPEFCDHRGYGDAPFSKFRAALKLSTYGTIAQLVDALPVGLKGGSEYQAKAKALAAQQGVRVALFGHTHEPALWPTGVVGKLSTFYVNSGCWRRVVRRASPSGPFVGTRVASHFIADPAGAADLECFQLHTEWRAT